MARNDDWFFEFINQYRPWLVRGSSSQIGRGLDLIAGGQAGRNEWKWNVASLPFIGDFYKWQDANNYWSDYFANRGMSWSDALYPTMMKGAGAGAGAIARGADTVLSKSKTLGRLYEGLGQDHGDWSPRNRR
nr:MAG: hypothetical protein [Smacoviridae sp.]